MGPVAVNPAAVNELLDRHREALRHMVARLDQRLSRRVDASDVVDVCSPTPRRLPARPASSVLTLAPRDGKRSDHRPPSPAPGRDPPQPRQRAATFTRELRRPLIARTGGPVARPRSHSPRAALRKELHERFLDALDRMDEEDREVLVMRHIEQLSNSDAAAAFWGSHRPPPGCDTCAPPSHGRDSRRSVRRRRTGRLGSELRPGIDGPRFARTAILASPRAIPSRVLQPPREFPRSSNAR